MVSSKSKRKASRKRKTRKAEQREELRISRLGVLDRSAEMLNLAGSARRKGAAPGTVRAILKSIRKGRIG